MNAYVLFIVLFSGSPILGVAFAVGLLGLHPRPASFPATSYRLSKQELHAMQLAAKEAARGYDAKTRTAAKDEHQPMLGAGNWRQVLGLPLNEHRRSVAHQAYRALARAHHPDLSGSNVAMQAVNDAWRRAKKELVLH